MLDFSLFLHRFKIETVENNTVISYLEQIEKSSHISQLKVR